jgi:hypothetical protein
MSSMLLASRPVGRERDDVGGAWPDLLVAPRAAIGLRRSRTGDPTYDPVAVIVLLDVLVRTVTERT